MASPLEEIAVAADEVVRDEREVARRTRQMQRKLDRGWTWRRVLDDEPTPSVIELLRRSARRANEARASLTSVLAGHLSGEGLSRRQIAARLQVSHQRVTTLLNGSRRRAEG